jgi:hypothetical protein
MARSGVLEEALLSVFCGYTRNMGRSARTVAPVALQVESHTTSRSSTRLFGESAIASTCSFGHDVSLSRCFEGEGRSAAEVCNRGSELSRSQCTKHASVFPAFGA